jgi:protein SCO1
LSRQLIITGIACLSTLLISVTLVYLWNSARGLSNEQLNENGLFIYESPIAFADFNLIDQDEVPFNKDRLLDKWSLVFFGYTYCPDICPLTMATLSQFSRLLKETNFAADTQVIMISVDPVRDTPEKLRDYVGFFNQDYIGVTGDYASIFTLALQLNISFSYGPGYSAENSGEAGDYMVSHSGVILLINPDGQYHGVFKLPHEANQILENYLALRK